MAKVDEIEGIGRAMAEKLRTAGVATDEALLERGQSAKGRADLAAATGIGEARILKWVNMADLMRISGVGEEFSELLEAAGVDTVKELKQRRPDNLQAKLAEVNDARKLCRRTPSLAEVERWVEQAKTLPAVVSY